MIFKIKSDARIGERFLRGKHSTGLDVCIMPKKGFSKYYAVYATNYGSMNNKFSVDGQNITVPDGTAHFLEHKLFEDKNGANAFDGFSRLGASPNAFTSFNITAYLFSCTNNFYENLDLLLNFVNNPYFTDENVQKEQGIIGQEIVMYDDDPNWRVFVNMLGGLYKYNPIKIDISGNIQSIAKITPQVLYTCYNTFYTPSNMVLLIVGDIDKARVIEALDKNVRRGEAKHIEKILEVEPAQVNERIVRKKLNVSMPLFQIGFKEPHVGKHGVELLKKDLITKVALDILAGSSQDFYMNLYNKELINDNFGWESEFESNYGFSTFSGESKDPMAVYELIEQHIKNTKSTGVKQEDTDRSKKILMGKYLRQFNNIERLGNYFMKVLFSGVNVFDTFDIIKSITVKDVNERLDEGFGDNNSTLSIIEPVSGR